MLIKQLDETLDRNSELTSQKWKSPVCGPAKSRLYFFMKDNIGKIVVSLLRLVVISHRLSLDEEASQDMPHFQQLLNLAHKFFGEAMDRQQKRSEEENKFLMWRRDVYREGFVNLLEVCTLIISDFVKYFQSVNFYALEELLK